MRKTPGEPIQVDNCEDKNTEDWCKNVIAKCPCSCKQYDIVKFDSKGKKYQNNIETLFRPIEIYLVNLPKIILGFFSLINLQNEGIYKEYL